MASELIRQSLETLAARVGDPTAQVYARLFAAYPDAQALFVGDRTGAARGEMLAQAVGALLDIAEGGRARLIRLGRAGLSPMRTGAQGCVSRREGALLPLREKGDQRRNHLHAWPYAVALPGQVLRAFRDDGEY